MIAQPSSIHGPHTSSAPTLDGITSASHEKSALGGKNDYDRRGGNQVAEKILLNRRRNRQISPSE